MFHASLTKVTKQAIQREFQSPSSILRCLVAMIAFGMVGALFFLHNIIAVYTALCISSQGMDIPDVELVVMHGTPDTVSQFYQVEEHVFVILEL